MRNSAPKGRKVGPALVLALGLAALSACAPLVTHHGYVPAADELASITVGQDTRDSVLATLGAPGATGLADAQTVYYVASTFKQVGPFRPEETDRRVVAISFDSVGRVANVEEFGLERGQVVTLSRRVTEGAYVNMTLVRQLLNALGRFNPATVLGEN